MTAGTVLALLLGFLAAGLIAAPLFRRDAAEAERVSATLSEAQELQSRRDMLLASLKDLDDDRATDKIGEADFAELQQRLSAQAVDVMRRLDELEAATPAAPQPRALRSVSPGQGKSRKRPT